MGKSAYLGLAVLCVVAWLSPAPAHAQGASDAQIAQFRARTVSLFRELAQLRQEQVLVFGVTANALRFPSFGADNPRAHAWLQKARRHLAQAPPGIGCWDDLGLLVCDHELLLFVGAGYDEFHTLLARFWLLTVCTEHPQTCRPGRRQP